MAAHRGQTYSNVQPLSSDFARAEATPMDASQARDIAADTPSR